MRVRLTALAAWAFACAAAFPAMAAAPALETSPLTLDQAFTRVARAHPDLRLLDARGDVLAAESDRAALRPAVVAGVQIENALGSGDYRGLHGAELTLTLASVLERGGKLDARRVLAQSRIDALAVERHARQLDLLAEVARRYLAITAARHQRDIAVLDMAQREKAVDAAHRRLQAGASPESVLLTAQAASTRADLARARARQQEEAARQHLAALWGEKDPHFDIAASDPLALPTIEDASALSTLLERTPELAQFVDERRVREARLQLARSSASADVDWQIGVRRLQGSSDAALVAGFSVPLGSRRRAEPEIRSAEAELSALEIERESKGLSLYSTLVEAHGRYRVAQFEVERLRDAVLPQLARAEAAAERAYRAGAISYLEWSQLQSERISATRQQLDAAIDAHRALIEIQRLTGQAFVAARASRKEDTP